MASPYNTIWLFNIAMENDPFIDLYIDDFPINTFIYSGFSMAVLNNQRVTIDYPLDDPSKNAPNAHGTRGITGQGCIARKEAISAGHLAIFWRLGMGDTY